MDSKSNGSFNQSIDTILRLYDSTCRANALSDTQKSNYFIHILHVARQNYMNYFEEHITYHYIFKMMLLEYNNSDACQI